MDALLSFSEGDEGLSTKMLGLGCSSSTDVDDFVSLSGFWTGGGLSRARVSFCIILMGDRLILPPRAVLILILLENNGNDNSEFVLEKWLKLERDDESFNMELPLLLGLADSSSESERRALDNASWNSM